MSRENRSHRRPSDPVSAAVADLERSLRAKLRESVEPVSGPLITPAELYDDWPGRVRPAYPHGYPQDRKHGQNWPVIRNEQDLRQARAFSRFLADTNPLVIGFVGHIGSYVVGPGFKWSVGLKGVSGDDPAEKKDPAVQACQQFLDEFRQLNGWGDTGEITVGDFEDEADDSPPTNLEIEGWESAMEDGELFLRLFAGGPGTNGVPRVRKVNPECVYCPPGETQEGPWSFGIETDPDDRQRRLNYHVANPDKYPQDGEIVPASRIVHLKLNAKTDVKRGVPDFWVLEEEATHLRKLWRNMGEVGAILSAIAYIRQHAPGVSGTQIKNMNDQLKNGTVNANGWDRSAEDIIRQYTRMEAGTQIDITNGQQWVDPPLQSGIPNFVQGMQAILRVFGLRWGCPEYFSGDASNANFASTLVSGGPFERATIKRQQDYKRFQGSLATRALLMGVKAGRLTKEQVMRVSVKITPPAVAIANKAEDTGRRVQLMQAAGLSKRTVLEEEGYDPDREAANVAKEQPQQGQQGPGDPGAGAGVPQGGATPDQGGDPLAGLFSESVGPPPWPGAVFDTTSHRWKNPEGGGGTDTTERAWPHKTDGMDTSPKAAWQTMRGDFGAAESGPPPVMFRGSFGPYDPAKAKGGWSFWSPTRDYAENYGSNITVGHVAIRRPIDLRQFSGTDDVDREDVSAALADHGIDVPPTGLGRGEIHQVLEPARAEIRRQAMEKGYDGLVQNENFDGQEAETWATFTPDQATVLPPGIDEADDAHEYLVRAALAAGKPVPAEVLADYPDINDPKSESVLFSEAAEQAEPVSAELLAAILQAHARGDDDAVAELVDLAGDPALLAAVLDGPPADAVTEAVDRSHLVFDKLKKRWVNPNKEAPVRKTPAGELTPKEQLVARKQAAEPARAAARQAWGEAVAKGVTADQLRGLADHLGSLTRDELRAVARGLQKRVGGLKRELVDRLLQHVGQEPTGGGEKKAEPVADKKPTADQKPPEAAVLDYKNWDLTDAEYRDQLTAHVAGLSGKALLDFAGQAGFRATVGALKGDDMRRAAVVNKLTSMRGMIFRTNDGYTPGVTAPLIRTYVRAGDEKQARRMVDDALKVEFGWGEMPKRGEQLAAELGLDDPAQYGRRPASPEAARRRSKALADAIVAKFTGTAANGVPQKGSEGPTGATGKPMDATAAVDRAKALAAEFDERLKPLGGFRAGHDPAVTDATIAGIQRDADDFLAELDGMKLDDKGWKDLALRIAGVRETTKAKARLAIRGKLTAGVRTLQYQRS